MSQKKAKLQRKLEKEKQLKLAQEQQQIEETKVEQITENVVIRPTNKNIEEIESNEVEDFYEHCKEYVALNRKGINFFKKLYKKQTIETYTNHRKDIISKLIALTSKKIFDLSDESLEEGAAISFIRFLLFSIFSIRVVNALDDYTIVRLLKNVPINLFYGPKFIEPIFSTPLEQLKNIYFDFFGDFNEYSDDSYDDFKNYVDQNDYTINCVYDIVLASMFLSKNLFLKTAELIFSNERDLRNITSSYFKFQMLRANVGVVLTALSLLISDTFEKQEKDKIKRYLSFVDSNLSKNLDICTFETLDLSYEEDKRVVYVALDIFYLVNCGMLDPRKLLEINSLLDLDDDECTWDEDEVHYCIDDCIVN